MKTILLPTLGAVVLMILAGCSQDETMPSSTTTTTTEESTSNAPMPTPQNPAGTTSTTESTETHTVAPQ